MTLPRPGSEVEPDWEEIGEEAGELVTYEGAGPWRGWSERYKRSTSAIKYARENEDPEYSKIEKNVVGAFERLQSEKTLNGQIWKATDLYNSQFGKWQGGARGSEVLPENLPIDALSKFDKLPAASDSVDDSARDRWSIPNGKKSQIKPQYSSPTRGWSATVASPEYSGIGYALLRTRKKFNELPGFPAGNMVQLEPGWYWFYNPDDDPGGVIKSRIGEQPWTWHSDMHAYVAMRITKNHMKRALLKDTSKTGFYSLFTMEEIANKCEQIYSWSNPSKSDKNFVEFWGGIPHASSQGTLIDEHGREIPPYGINPSKKKPRRIGNGKSSKDPCDDKAGEVAAEERPQPISEQAILLYHLKDLSQRNRDFRKNRLKLWGPKYDRVSTIDIKNPTEKDAASLLNLLLSRRDLNFLFEELKPSHLTALIPRIRVFKPIYDKSPDKQEKPVSYREYEFEEYPEFATRPELLGASLGTSTGVGLVGFEWKLIGQNASILQANTLMEATLKMRAQNVDELLAQRTNSKGETYSYSDMFFPKKLQEQLSNGLTSGKAVVAPSNFRSRVIVEYVADRTNLIWKQEPELAAKVNGLKQILELTTVQHSLNLNDDGSLNIDLQCIASIDADIADPVGCNILDLENSATLRIQKEKLLTDRAALRSEAEKTKTTLDKLERDSENYEKLQKQLRDLNEKLLPNMSDDDFLNFSTAKLSKQEIYADITNRLLLKDRFASLEVDPCDVTRVKKILPTVPSEDDASEADIETYNSANSGSASPFYRKDSYKIPFIYYGDLLDIVLDKLSTAEGFTGIDKTPRTILGPVIFEDSSVATGIESGVELDKDTGKITLRDFYKTKLDCQSFFQKANQDAQANLPGGYLNPLDPSSRTGAYAAAAAARTERASARETVLAAPDEDLSEFFDEVDPFNAPRNLNKQGDKEFTIEGGSFKDDAMVYPSMRIAHEKKNKENKKVTPAKASNDKDVYTINDQRQKPAEPPKKETQEFDECGRPIKKKYAVNIGDIPISFRLFQRWWSEKVINRGLYTYTLKEFISDSLNSLVFNALQPKSNEVLLPLQDKEIFMASFDAVAPAWEPDVFRFQDFNFSKSLAGDYVVSDEKYEDLLYIEDMLANSGMPGAGTLPLETGDAKDAAPDVNMEKYLLIYAREIDNSRIYTGKRSQYERDLNAGIYHLHSGREVGVVKDISLQVVNWAEYEADKLVQGLRAANNVKGNLVPIKRVYNATVTLFGTPTLKPGQIIYLNPAAHGSVENLSKLGMVGYYTIIDITSQVEAGQYLTTLSCAFQSPGDCPDVA